MIEYRKSTIDDLDSLLKTRIDFLRYAKNIRTEEDVKILLEANRTFLIKSLTDGSYIQ